MEKDRVLTTNGNVKRCTDKRIISKVTDHVHLPGKQGTSWHYTPKPKCLNRVKTTTVSEEKELSSEERLKLGKRLGQLWKKDY